MPHRADITQTLIHFVSAESNAEALEKLWSIVFYWQLWGSNRMIRGLYSCVCFTETPLELVRETLLEAEETGHRYKPFGVAVQKGWLFDRGGRPVIYGPPDQFEELPELMRWRHVRYEPTGTPPVDFTWEREWRVHADVLPIDPDSIILVVPDSEALEELQSRHYVEEQDHLRQMEEEDSGYTAWDLGRSPRPFPWEVYLLADNSFV